MRPSASTSAAARRSAGPARGSRRRTRDNNIAEILSDQGRLDEAERLVRGSLRTHRAAEYPMGIAYSIQHLGRIMARGGRTAEARDLLIEALDLWVEIGSAASTTETEAKLAEAMLLEGNHAGALAVLAPGDRAGAAARRRPVVAGPPAAAPGQRAGAGRRP